MYKIQTLNKIDPKGLENFPAGRYEIADNMANPDAIVLRSFKMFDMELPSSLKAVARAGAGVNNIPIEKCTEKGIVVFNTPGANANGVKELVIAGLLLSSRDIAEGIGWAKTLIGQGSQVPALIEKGKTAFGGQEIQGKTLAVIGLGAIGILVANAAQALGMNVLGYDPYLSVKQALRLNPNVKCFDSADALLSNADYISLHIPLTSETKEFINKDKFSLMKNGASLLNFARGELVSTPDVAEALESGKLHRYVTDFPDEEILKIEHVIAIPHLGASTEESETNCAIMAVNQVKEFLENGNIVNSVNFPAAELGRNDGTRIVVANKNGSNTVGQISATIAGLGFNISNMLSKSRDGISYSIIDIDVHCNDTSVAEKISAIDGVFMARVLL